MQIYGSAYRVTVRERKVCKLEWKNFEGNDVVVLEARLERRGGRFVFIEKVPGEFDFIQIGSLEGIKELFEKPAAIPLFQLMTLEEATTLGIKALDLPRSVEIVYEVRQPNKRKP